MNSASVSGSQGEAPALPVGNLSESRERALVLSHFAAVWRALRRFGLSAADADDAAQQVFLAAVPRVGEIEPNRERAFLCGIAANVAKKARRSLARRREQLSDVETHIDPQPTSEDLLERRKARLLLDRMLEALEHDVRVVFVLHEIEELTAPEIAEALAIPLGTVASRLRRGREQFARGLARYRARTKGRK